MPKQMKKGWSEKDLKVLRDWQKLSVSRRCTVAELARRVRRARKTVSDLLKKKSVRKQITKQRTKQCLNKSVPVFKRTQEHKKKRTVKEIVVMALACPDCGHVPSLSTCARTTRPRRLLFLRKKAAFWAAWHKKYPNRGLLASQENWRTSDSDFVDLRSSNE